MSHNKCMEYHPFYSSRFENVFSRDSYASAYLQENSKIKRAIEIDVFNVNRYDVLLVIKIPGQVFFLWRGRGVEKSSRRSFFHLVSRGWRHRVSINRGEQQAAREWSRNEGSIRRRALCFHACKRTSGRKQKSGGAHSGNWNKRNACTQSLGPPRTPATCLPDKNTKNRACSRGPPPPRLSLTIYWKKYAWHALAL